MINYYEFQLLESVIYDYERKLNTPGEVQYSFKADDLKYSVSIWNDPSKHDFGMYEVEFSVSGQKSTGDRTGKDLKHLNSVLRTVCEIVEKEVKEKKIKVIKIEGAQDANDTNSFLEGNKRSKIYLRFITNRYGQEAVSGVAKWIRIDMTKIFPKLFQEKLPVDIIVDELVRISDLEQDREGIMRGVSGNDKYEFGISSDFIESSKYGVVYFEINVSKSMDMYDLTWDSDNEINGETSGEKYFESFGELLSFLKKI